MEIIKRRENETDFEYGLRLIEYKVENNPTDLDWQDIIDILGLSYHRDTLRKSSQSQFGGYNVYKYMKEKLESKSSQDLSSEILSKLELEKIELEKEKIKVRDQKREYRKMIREIARAEYLKEYIQDSALEIAKEKPIMWEHNQFNLTGDNEAVAMIGDYHVGMEVNNFLNTYNKEIFKERFKKHISKIIEYGKINKIVKLNILDLGDNISGIIHNTTRILNNEDVISQIQYVSEVFAEGFVELANNFSQVEYYSVLDNHSRVTANIKDSIDCESFARIIPWYLKSRLSNVSNFTINDNKLDDDIAIFDVCGYKCMGVHGNKDNPKNVVSNLTLMTKIVPDYVFMGHYHRSVEENINGVFVIGNPSGIGTDDYAKNMRLSGQAQQKMVIFNVDEGRFATYNITL